MRRKFVVTIDCNPQRRYEDLAHRLESILINNWHRWINTDYFAVNTKIEVRKTEPRKYIRKLPKGNIG